MNQAEMMAAFKARRASRLTGYYEAEVCEGCVRLPDEFVTRLAPPLTLAAVDTDHGRIFKLFGEAAAAKLIEDGVTFSESAPAQIDKGMLVLPQGFMPEGEACAALTGMIDHVEIHPASAMRRMQEEVNEQFEELIAYLYE